MNSSGTSLGMGLTEQRTVAIHHHQQQEEDQEMTDLHYSSSPSPINDTVAEEEDLTIQWDVTMMGATDASIDATSSGVDTSSDTASFTSLSLHHLPTLNRKTTTHCHPQDRSASQPRAPAVQVADQETSNLLIHKTQRRQRSTSQPWAAAEGSSSASVQQKQHFLQGYNMGSHRLDVRSIPDPPAPLPPQSRSHQSRRRASLSSHQYVASKNATAAGWKVSLEDVTNQGLATGSTLNSTSASASTNDSDTKKKRKTMNLLPTPSSPGFEGQNHRVCLAHDDDDEEEHEDGSPPKRRKRRQSMVLPINVDGSDADSSPSKTPRDQQKMKPSSPVPFKGDMASMRELQKLVRNYCAKPNSERESCQELAMIRQLTGYTLSGSTTKRDLNEDKNQGVIHQGRQSKSTVLLASSRRLVMEKLGPVMAEMERRKVEDKEKWEHATGCRVTKSQRSGKYRYFCMTSNMKVSSQDYKGRYMSVLEQEKLDRESKAQAWKGLLLKPSVDSSANCFDDEIFRSDCGLSDLRPDHEEKIIAGALDPQVSHRVPSDQQGPSLDVFSEESEIVPDEYVQREAFLPPKNQMRSRRALPESSIFPVSTFNDCDRSSILPIAATVSNSDFDESSDISRAASGESDDSQNDAKPQFLADKKLLDADRDSVSTEETGPGNCLLLDSGSLLHSEDAEVPIECSDSGKEASTISDLHEPGSDEGPLLPIPSRDDKSADPKIAMAEKRLWEKIDKALREYSQEVTEINLGKSGTTGKPISA